MMDNGNFTPNTMLGTLRENTMDFDLMDELLYDGCWLETTTGSNYWQRDMSTSSPSNLSPIYVPSSETSKIDYLNPTPPKGIFEKETERSNSIDNPHPIYPQKEAVGGSQTHNSFSSQSQSFLSEGTETNRRLWTGPSGKLSPSAAMKKRLMQAFEYLKESTRDRDVLIQIWVPTKRGGKRVLTTNNQPFSLNLNCRTLADYRDVSRRYQFAIEGDSKEMVGLPGRVYLKRLPEWTPDVRFFRTEEYPRVNYAFQYNVSGSIALPVFERGSGTCLGVVEIITTSQKVNYRPELENVCKALQAVDLRSSEILSTPKTKDPDKSYQDALAEIQEVLKSVSEAHKLPLAQAWAPCVQQGKGGSRISDENHAYCISIVDTVCYVPNAQVLGFHEACSEHHLLKGEGIVGGAFMTNQLCFANDITAFSKTEYPLSHHARMFPLRAAVAIRLRSIYTGSADFVLEFFLPLDFKDVEEQKQMLSSLWAVIQQVCRSLRAVTDQEQAEEKNALPVREMVAPSEAERANMVSFSSNEATHDESSWIARMVEAQKKGKGISVSDSLGYEKNERGEGFRVLTHWDSNETELHHTREQKDYGINGSAEVSGDLSSIGRQCPSGARKASEKRRTKTERAISLQVLRQYFSGSLKDAAKSIGVCPTTLKRICRQHGITRWPSRKIKKVGHSLQKLQLVIDSVEGAEGAIKLSSFYTNFPELSSPKLDDPLNQLTTQPEGLLLISSGTTGSKSHSSSSSGSHSSSSSFCRSNQPLSTGNVDAFSAEEVIKRARSNAELHGSVKVETNFLVRSHSHKIFRENPSLETLPPLPKSSSEKLLDNGIFRVKATFAGEKIRFSMPQQWGFGDLQQEIVRRFTIDDISGLNLKYLDDDSEWVLLTCDDDLDECIDIHRLSRSRTIKLSLHQAFRLNLGRSFDSSGPS